MRYLIGVVTLLGLLLVPPQRALACSPGAPAVPLYAEWAEVVTVGTLVEDQGDVISLQVEEYLKGTLRAPTLVVNNHSFDFAANCEISLAGPGRMPAGLRVLAFLQRDEFRTRAHWRPVGLAGEGILKIEDGGLKSITWEMPPLGTLDEVKGQLAGLIGPAHAPDPSAPGESPSGKNPAAALSSTDTPGQPGDRWRRGLIVLGLVAMSVVVLAGGLMFRLRRRRALAE